MKKVTTTTKTLCALLFSSAVVLSFTPTVSASQLVSEPALNVARSMATEQTTVNYRANDNGFSSQDVNEQTGISKVNINLASYAQLVALPGIGKVKAQAIISYRKEVGMFATLSEVQKVKGIGEKLFVKLQSKIMI